MIIYYVRLLVPVTIKYYDGTSPVQSGTVPGTTQESTGLVPIKQNYEKKGLTYTHTEETQTHRHTHMTLFARVESH